MAAEVATIDPERASGPEPDPILALFPRRIEFQPARRPFNGFASSNKRFKLVSLNPTNPHKDSGSSKKSEKSSSELPDIGLDPEFNLEITFRRIGAGLRNLGNTCFLNSVLQCLTYTAPLAAYLQSGKHQNNCRHSGFCALCAIQKHVSRALQSSGRILEPKDLVSNLRCISRNFRNARQEDAHEYMVNLLESMHKCCLPSGVPSESPSAYEKSLVHKIFGGRLRSQVKCMQCSFCSNKFDPFLDLSLEIVKADSVQKALAHFTTKEQLDGGAKQYHCQQCKQKVRALKQLTVHKAPHVLTVHLKRFSSHSPGQKIDKKIVFGPTLDMKPFVTGPYDGDLNYTLYGVLVHAGWSTHSGHYYCFVRTSSGMWYSLDDNQVIQVSERKVLEQKAYMLFYVRDRRNFCTKKPVDVVKKENMVLNAMENAANSKFNGLKEKIGNGSVDKKLNGSFIAPLSEDVMVTATPKETSSTSIPSQNVNGKMSMDHLTSKDSQTEHSAVVPPMKDLPKDHPTSNTDVVNHKGESHSTLEGSGDALTLGHAAKNVLGNNSSDVVDKKELAVILPDCNGSQDSLDKKESSESAEQPLNSSVLFISGDTSKMNGTNPEMVEGSSGKTDDSSTIVETHENGQKLKDIQSKSSLNKRPEIKVKRKLFKSQLVTMSLSSNILFGMGHCKQKKKHKRRKHNSLPKNSSSRKHMLDGSDLQSSLEQFTAETSTPVPTNYCTPSPEKKAKCESDSKSHNPSVENIMGKGECLSSDVINNEFRERVLLDGSALSAGKQPQISPCVAQGPGNSEDHRSELRQTVAMSMLTSLEETTVARWDGIDVSHSAKMESRAARAAQIGYIGDEWDEEYDRGKRKKIRASKIDFEEPNVFQEIANKKLKHKESKAGRMSSRNGPFRI